MNYPYELIQQISSNNNEIKEKLIKLESDTKLILSLLVQKGSIDELILRIQGFYKFKPMSYNLYECNHIANKKKYKILISKITNEEKTSNFNVKIIEIINYNDVEIANINNTFDGVIVLFKNNLDEIIEPYN